MKKLIFFIIISFLAFSPMFAMAVNLTVNPIIGPTLSDIVINSFSNCFDLCHLTLYKSDGSYVAGAKEITTFSAPTQSELSTGTKTIADLGFSTTDFGDYILMAYRGFGFGSPACSSAFTLDGCLSQGAIEANTATFTLGGSPTPTPTPSATPTPTPSPTPTPTDNQLLQLILSETQTIGGFISDIVAKLTTILSSMANLATESTLGLIKIKIDNMDTTLSGIKLQTDKFTFDPSNYLKITGIVSSNWEAGTALGHGFIVTTDEVVLSNKNENDVLLIKNPSSSGKIVRLNRVLIGADDKSSIIMRVYRSPAVTSNGIALSINELRSGNTTAMQAFRLPTVSAKGTKLDSNRITSSGREIDYELGFLVSPGEIILITLQSDEKDNKHAGTTLSITWLED